MLKRLPSSRYSTWTPSSCPITRWKRQVMAERNMIKSTGAKTQPCFTPTFTSKDSDWSCPVSTLACIPSCSCFRMQRNLGGTPSLERFFQSRSWLMVSKALLRSIKAYVKVFVLFSALLHQLPQDKKLSVVDLDFRKPH